MDFYKKNLNSNAPKHLLIELNFLVVLTVPHHLCRNDKNGHSNHFVCLNLLIKLDMRKSKGYLT
jgi:hypothetical protein